MISKRMVCLSEDDSFIELIQSLAVQEDYSAIVSDEKSLKKRMASDWDFVVLFDLDHMVQPVDVLRSLKEVNAGIPMIAVTRPNRMPLTTAAVLRGNGVDALIWKPIEAPNVLFESVEAGFKKIARWQHSLSLVAESETAEVQA